MLVIMSTMGLHLVGFQECDPPRYKLRVRKKWPGTIGLGPIKDNTYSTPISYARKRFHVLSWHNFKLYDGESGISLTRRLTQAVFEELKSGLQVGMINLHGPVVKNDSKHLIRLAMRNTSKSTVLNHVTALLSQGLPVIVTADFNDTANWFGGLDDRYKVTRIRHGIDQIILNAPSGYKWEVLSENDVDTPSDHNTLRSRVRLTRL